MALLSITTCRKKRLVAFWAWLEYNNSQGTTVHPMDTGTQLTVRFDLIRSSNPIQGSKKDLSLVFCSGMVDWLALSNTFVVE